MPLNSPPQEVNMTRTQRVLEWVNKSFSSPASNSKCNNITGVGKDCSRKKVALQMEKSSSVKRRLVQDENANPCSQNKKLQKEYKDAVRPQKFYNADPVSKSDQDHTNSALSILKTKVPVPSTAPSKVTAPSTTESKVPAPSTPESKLSSSTLFSPSKLDGILVRQHRRNQMDTDPVTSDSEPSTPVKVNGSTPKSVTTPKLHLLSCGLDSPESSSVEKCDSTRFCKLGHRLGGAKTPLQVYKEAIGFHARQLSRSSRKPTRPVVTPVTTPVKPIHSSASPTISKSYSPVSSSNETDSPSTRSPVLEARLDNSRQTETGDSSTIRGESAAGSVVRVDTDSTNQLDKTSNTLTTELGSTQKKLLPFFKRSLQSKGENHQDQLVIDAGQKELDGAQQCPTCRMVYCRGDPSDETLHKQFHSQLVQALKFTGWKKENIAEHGSDHRIIYIEPNDPPHCLKKVQALKVILDQELGFIPEDCMLKSNRRLYLYVGSDKTIHGVCLVESISQANFLLGDSVSERPVSAHIGVNRIWVYAKYRRQGVATRMLDVIRSSYGWGICVPRSNIAFSDPTSHGKSFAEQYAGTRQFLVYKP